MAEPFDLIVIGAGPAGEKGAAQAAYFGKRVALVERADEPGGACVNTGTLPSKTLREAALHLSGLASRGLAVVDPGASQVRKARELLNRLHIVCDSEHGRIKRNIERHKIEYVQGRGAFADPRTVLVHGAGSAVARTLTAPNTLIATGSSPHRPKEVPFDNACVWDSDSVLALHEIPRSIAVIGAGVIGSEYACIFSALGCDVTLLDGRDRAMPFLDTEIGATLVREMEHLGVKFRMSAKIKSYEKREGPARGVRVVLESGEILERDSLLFAAGRSGNTRDIGLEKVGIVPDKRGQLKVNEHYQTDVPHIYAAGDVIGFPALASTSMDQGRLAVCHALGLTYRLRLSEHLPMGIYTIPEVSAAGETEESAREKKLDFEVGRARFLDNARAEIMGDTGGLLKLVFDADTLRVIGVHIVCERASEIITPGLVAIRAGLGIDFFIDTVFNFPTLSEAYKYAAYDGLGRLADRGRQTGKSMK